MKARFAHLLAAAWLAVAATGAAAQAVKVGVVLPYSGVGAEFGQQVDRGMQIYLKLNPNAFGPYKVEFIKRDSKAPSGAAVNRNWRSGSVPVPLLRKAVIPPGTSAAKPVPKR